MPKILFTHSYFLRFDHKQWELMQPFPPLGTIYAAALMRREGYEVSLFDPMFSTSPAEISDYLGKYRPDYVVIYDDGFNYLTKMCLTNMREAAFEMSRLSRLAGCRVIVNSSDSADHYEKYLDHGADFIIAGEGEITLLELFKKIEAGETNFGVIDGLIYRQGNTIVNKKRNVLHELDSLPPPAWDLVGMDEYRNRWMKSTGYFSVNMSTTRGCPFKCNWCAKPIYGNRYNVHSPQRVIEDLKFLIDKYRVHYFWMTDDIFGLKPGWVNEFAQLVEKEKLKIKFKIQSRVDLLLQENNIAALAKAGCDVVWVGAESGSQKILDAMDKGTTVEQIFAATRLLKKHGMKVAFFLQFGYPGETREDIEKTINMVMELMPDDIGVSVSYPLPGTKFYESVKDELSDKSNWTDSDELALMFHNTFPAPFYRELQRYLHRRFRSRQGLIMLKKIISDPTAVSRMSLSTLGKAPFHFAGSYVHAARLNSYYRRKRVAN